MKKSTIILSSILLFLGVYSDNIDKNICMMKDDHVKHAFVYRQLELAKNKNFESEDSATINPSDYSFAYLEFTAFPTRLETNTFGVALGYRVSEGENSGSDYSFHVMRNASKEIIIAGKANHLFYAMEKGNMFSPYIGFGLMFGVAPEHDVISKEDGHYVHRVSKELEYKGMMDGEVVVGFEYKLNSNTRQFFELTYFANTEILQLSIGLGF